MQTGTVADRVTVASLLADQKVSAPVFTVRDLRIRNWTRVQAGALEYSAEFKVVTNVAGEVVRARILSDGTLDIRYCTPGASPSWSANTVTATSVAGWGVALYASGDTLDVFYIHTNALAVYTRRSTDGGHTWGSASTVTTLSAQPNGKVAFFSAPAQNILFVADSSSGMTKIQVVIYSGGSWTAQTWDIGGIAGSGPVEIYGSGQYLSDFDTRSIGTNDYLIVFYAAKPRGTLNTGLFTVRVSNLASGLTPHWQQLEQLFATNSGNAQVGAQTYPTLFIAFPQCQTINSEYWVTALEISGYVGNNIQHLCLFRSPDGVNFTNRQIIAGTDIYFNQSSTPVLFGLDDLKNAQVLVSGNYIYLFAFDDIFRTDATYLCGVDNALKKLTISSDVQPNFSWRQPEDGQAATITFTLYNDANAYNGFDDVDAVLRSGAQIAIETGYFTTTGEERVTVYTGTIDRIEQTTALRETEIVNALSITCRDMAKRIKDDAGKPDIFYSYQSPSSVDLTSIGDLTAFSVYRGNWQTSGGELMGGLLGSNTRAPDNMAALSETKRPDGIFEAWFKCLGVWTNSYFGMAFQIKGDTEHLVVMYDGTNFSLYKTVPSADGAGETHTYSLVDSVGGTTRQTSASLTVGTKYYLLVQMWHNRIVALYSTDEQSWTKVIDYAPLPTADLTYVGVIQKGKVDSSTPLGEPHQPADVGLDSTTYFMFLNDPNPANLGKTLSLFFRVKTGKQGVLRTINAAISRVVTGSGLSYLPDITFQFWKDYGDGTKPADLSDLDNKLFESTLSSVNVFSQSFSNAVRWTSISVNEDVPVDANTYYWVCVKPTADISPIISGGQSVVPVTPNSVLVMPASHASHVANLKCVYQYNPLDLTNFYDFTPGTNGVPGSGGAGSAFCVFVTTSYDASGIVVQGLRYVSGEYPRTIEALAKALVTKAGTLSYSFDSWISDTFASALDTGNDDTEHTWNNDGTGTWTVASGQLEAYHATGTSWAFLRTNTYWGERGDNIIDVDMTILAASKRAGVLWRATGAPSSFTSAYLLDVSTETVPMVRLSKIVAGVQTLLFAMPSLASIPTNTQFHLTVLANAGCISIYINRVLAAAFWDSTIAPRGQVGLAVLGNVSSSTTCKFDNFRVPDVWKVKDQFTIVGKQSWESSLRQLLGKERIYFDWRYDGSFRMSTFSRRTIVATITQAIRTTKKATDYYKVSHIQPEGDRFADFFLADVLDSDGYRFGGQLDYTDAYTNEQAWEDAQVPARAFAEKSLQYEVQDMLAIPTLERESDVIQITNPLDETALGQFVIGNITTSFNRTDTDMRFRNQLGLRKLIS